MLSVLEDLHAVDVHVHHTGSVPVRIVIGCVILDLLGIKHHDVCKAARIQAAPALKL